ncbi:MAG TPA: Gldg family protein, partial [Planctomycetota bacterium]|nr:Gldg family protein [Planctomycetota bacterium]
KELTVVDKPKVKVLAPPLQSGSRGIPKSWRQIRNVTRYDFSDLDLSDGKLVPEDTDILLLVRPRDLNDRAKYAIDQYLMSGGKVVVFADTDDVDIGNQDHRSYVVWPMEYDSGDSKVKFVDMLATYGVELRTELVADLFRGNNATAQAFMARLVQTTTGLQHEQVFYPYLFHPLGVDWGSEQVAVQLATDPQTKQVDRERAAQYQAAFKHGLKNDHPLALGQTIGPDLFWPCPVDLVDKLPDGVRGDVIARTSPLTLLEKRPRTLNPFGDRAEPTAMFEALQRFQATIWGKLLAEPRRQVGLMVALEGTFPSAFAGKPLPPRRPPPPEPLPDPLTGRVGKEGEPASAQTDSDAVGPPVTGEGAAAEDDKDKDPPFRERAEPGAQLVVVGDSDFLRDDMLTYVYLQQGRSLVVGPASDQRAWAFYNAILDWLVQDDDLIALRSKVGTDRTIRLGEHDVMAGESAERFLQRVSRKAAILQWVNVLGPAVLLLVLWLVVAIRRARRKAAFVGSVQ